MITINETDKEFQVKFPYSDWMVRAIKQIPGRKFNGSKKHWMIPLSSRHALMTWASPYQHMVTQTKDEPVQIGEIDPLPDLLVEPPIRNDVKTMFTYQGQGVAYALEHKKTFMADEPGLGKTVQAIATVETLGCKCILIICPATLRSNWKHEIENIWTRKKALVLSNRVKKTWPTFYSVGMVKYFIVNFESLKKMFVKKITIPAGETFQIKHIEFDSCIDHFDAVIIDESHKCKDGTTQQSKFVMGITKEKPVVLALSGTPLVNNPKDLIAQLHIIGRLQAFGGYTYFMARYCGKKRKPGVLKELNYLMHKHCFYRRLKKDVLKELPDKMRNVIRCDITNMTEYQKASDNFDAYLTDNLAKSAGEVSKALRGEVMVQMQILKKLAARGKIEYVIEHIQNVLDSGEKFCLFAWHKEIVLAVKEAFTNVLTITGDDSMDERDAAVYKFQNDPKFQLMILNIKSGGVGLTLTASSRVGFIELPWHPADCDQCEDRCHRIGQKDSVEASYFLGYQTIDEFIYYDIIEPKRKVVKDVTGAEDIETNVVDQFISLFKQKK